MHKRTKKHHFDKDCCRVVKVRGLLLDIMLQNKRKIQNQNAMSTMIRRKEESEDYLSQNQQSLTYNNKNNGKFNFALKGKNLNGPDINRNDLSRFYGAGLGEGTQDSRSPQNETMKQSFGLSTQIQIIQDVNQNKQQRSANKLDDEDKENNVSRAKLLQQTSSQQNMFQAINSSSQQLSDVNQALPTIMQMLYDIKNQNTYLIEKNIELDQIVHGEIKPLMEDNFFYLRNEIREIKKEITSSKAKQYQQNGSDLQYPSQLQRYQLNHKIRGKLMSAVSSKYNFKPRSYRSSQKIINLRNGSREEDEEIKSQIYLAQNQNRVFEELGPQSLQDNSKVQSVIEGDSTFVRKLEDSVQVPQPQQVENSSEDNMRFSLGANLLQLMSQANNHSNNNENDQASRKGGLNKKGAAGRGRRGIRNFNFRCNLNEIDKIIEEDLNENGGADASNYCNSNSASPLNNQQINSQIREIEKQELQECSRFEMTAQYETNKYQSEEKINSATQEIIRPQTGQNKDGQIKQHRKLWGVQNDRPQTGAYNGPIRKVRGNISQQESQKVDILSLLAQENQDQQSNIPSREQTIIVGTIENLNLNSNSSNQSVAKDREMNIEELKSYHIDNKPLKSLQAQIPKPKLPTKRGMFKAPPSDLLDLLLVNDDEDANFKSKPIQLQSVRTPEKLNLGDSSISSILQPDKEVKMNNFMTERVESKSRSRSRSKIVINTGGINQIRKLFSNNNSNGKPRLPPQGTQINFKQSLALIDSDIEDDEDVKKKLVQSKTAGRLLEDDNPFPINNSLLQQDINQSGSSNSNQDIKPKRPLGKGIIRGTRGSQKNLRQGGLPSIEQLLMGGGSGCKDQDEEEDQFTQTEKEGIFFLNHGNKNHDDTADFGSL